MDEQKLLAVPAVRQTPGYSTCGPATLKMLLMYWQLPCADLTDVEIGIRCSTSTDIGTPPSALIEAGAQFGLTLEAKQHGTFDDMQEWLDKKIPVIVDWFAPPTRDDDEDVMADGHYSVVVGLDETSIYIQDPELGRLRTIDREDFFRVWFDFEGNFIASPDKMFVRYMCAAYPIQSQ